MTHADARSALDSTESTLCSPEIRQGRKIISKAFSRTVRRSVLVGLVLGAVIAVPATAASATPVSNGSSGSGDNGGWSAALNASPGAQAAIAKFKANAHEPKVGSSGPLAVATICPTGVSASLLTSAGVVPATTCPPPANRVLPVTWQQQVYGYWCAPATVSMTSNYFATGYSQSSAASLMKTDGTGTSVGNAVKGMATVSRQEPYVAIWAPSVDVLNGSLRVSIGQYGDPIAVNTHESKGGSHYNYHHDADIWHYILAVGYHSGGLGVYDDPASGMSGYTTSARQFNILSTLMVPYLRDRGTIPANHA